MDEKRTKLPERAFEVYKEEVHKWIGRLGLSEWDYRIKQTEIDEEDEDYLSWVTYNTSTRKASFWLPTTWPPESDATIENVRGSAIHEVLELLLADLREAATQEKIATNSEVHKYAHAIIHRLTNIFTRIGEEHVCINSNIVHLPGEHITDNLQGT